MYAIEIENNILGVLMTYPNLISEVRDILRPEMFSNKNKDVYKSISELEKENSPFDAMSVIEQLKKNKSIVDAYYVMTLTNNSIPNGLSKKASRISDLWMKRELVLFGNSISKKAFDNSSDVYDIISEMNEKTNNLLAYNSSGIFHIKDCVVDVMNVIENNISGNKLGILSGLTDLDKFTHGDQPGDLIIVAGETSQGKTAFALSKMFYQAMLGYRVAIFSYEMTRNQLTARLMALATEISSKRILMDKLNNQDLEKINARIKELVEANIYIIEVERKDLSWLENKIKTIVSKYAVQSIYIDYIQLITVNGLKRNEEVARIANDLKFLAKHKSVNIPITALSQLSRDRSNPKPSLSRLKESGDIENAADTVIGLWRPEYFAMYDVEIYQDGREVNINTTGLMLAHILKGRNIGLRDFIFNWDAALTRISDRSQIENTPF